MSIKERKVITIRDFRIDLNKENLKKIQKVLSKLYTAKDRIKHHPKDKIIRCLNQIEKSKNNRGYLSSHVSIDNFKILLSDFGYDIEETKNIIFDHSYYVPFGTTVLSLTECEKLCSNCNGFGSYSYRSKNGRKCLRSCKICKSSGKLTWIDEIKNNLSIK